MKRVVVDTADGSKTIRIIDLDENYHSSHGALQEAEHVFIKYGLCSSEKKNINIFEMGFGTGLNAFLTAKHNLELDKNLFYHGVEAYPVNSVEIQALGYNRLLGDEYELLYTKIHEAKWDEIQEINDGFSLLKSEGTLQELELKSSFYDLIYYDAFGPRAQDEMWSIELFEKMYDSLQKGGFLVTYCAKGQVKRNMKAVGFEIEPLPGPPGKREMTRAWKR